MANPLPNWAKKIAREEADRQNELSKPVDDEKQIDPAFDWSRSRQGHETRSYIYNNSNYSRLKQRAYNH